MSHGPDDRTRRTWLKQAALLVGGAAAATAPASALPTPEPAVAAAAEDLRVATPDNGIVATTAGKVRGFTRNGVHIFRGIPYGDTTAGANRFLPPQKPTPWTDVRSSTSWGPVCPQASRGGWRNDEEQFLYQWDDGFPGEDMLRINVWTPAVNDGRKRPVLAWIHGGGFVSGSSQELRPYDGENLARRHDVVLVSMNHRLNVFGFLDLSKAGGEKYKRSGNVGMLDLVTALEWVRDNVAGFGGDPGNVTIFGQSGGGRKVSTLLGMPAARGLFHKAAIFSGSHLRQGSPEGTAKLASAVLATLGVSDPGRLADLTTDQILKGGIDAQRSLAQPGAAGALGWGPVVDGDVLPQHAFDPAAPAISAGIPIMVGNTFVEFAGGIGNPDARATTSAQVRERLTPMLGARTDEVIAAYQKVFPKLPPFEIAGLVQGTQRYRLDAVTLAERKAAQNGAPVYAYWFGWRTPVLDGRPLAYHCQDLAFWFDNIDLAAQATGGGEEARSLAKTMSSALVAFARTGNPSAAGGPKWPAFTAADRQMMIFDNGQSAARRDPDLEARTLLLGALKR